jgi:ferredoxin
MDRLRLLDAGLRAFDSHLPDVTPSLCVATRYRSSSCRSCLDACPAEALMTSPWLELDAERCRSCGACVSVCRTGALRLEFQHEALRVACRSRATDDPGAVVLACRHADPGIDADVTFVMSCLGALSAADLLATAALGVGRLTLVSGDCAECADAAAEAALELAVVAAEETMAALGRSLVIARTRRSAREPAVEASLPTVSRRGLFRYLAQGLGQAAADGAAPKDPHRSIGTLHRQAAPPVTHQRLIVDLAELQTPGTGPAVGLPLSLPLAGIVETPECDQCGLCLSYCPHGALAIEGGSVVADPHRCTGCGLCVEVCPRSALRMVPALLPLRRLSRAEWMTLTAAGQTTSPAE